MQRQIRWTITLFLWQCVSFLHSFHTLSLARCVCLLTTGDHTKETSSILELGAPASASLGLFPSHTHKTPLRPVSSLLLPYDTCAWILDPSTCSVSLWICYAFPLPFFWEVGIQPSALVIVSEHTFCPWEPSASPRNTCTKQISWSLETPLLFSRVQETRHVVKRQ